MPAKKEKTVIAMPPFLTSSQVARMLDLDRSTIRKRVKADKYPGAFKPADSIKSVVLIPSSLFPEKQVLDFLKKERDQSPD